MKSVGNDFASVLVHQYIMFRAGCAFLPSLIRPLAGTSWSAGAMTLHTATLALVHSDS